MASLDDVWEHANHMQMWIATAQQALGRGKHGSLVEQHRVMRSASTRCARR
jgi:hypothetical protein